MNKQRVVACQSQRKHLPHLQQPVQVPSQELRQQAAVGMQG
jgi:hypothetical protein